MTALVEAFAFEFPTMMTNEAQAVLAKAGRTDGVVTVYTYAQFCGEHAFLEAFLRQSEPEAYSAYERVETMLCEALAAAQRGGLFQVDRVSQCLDGLSTALVKALELLHLADATYVDRLSSLVQLTHIEGASHAKKAWYTVYVMQFMLVTDFLRGRAVFPDGLKKSVGVIVNKALAAGIKVSEVVFPIVLLLPSFCT